MSNPLSFKALTDVLASVLDGQPDNRQPGKVSYRLSDAGLAAFPHKASPDNSVRDSVSVFFTQSPSFLAHSASSGQAYQRDMEGRKGTSNATTLFGMESIPSAGSGQAPPIRTCATCSTHLTRKRSMYPFARPLGHWPNTRCWSASRSPGAGCCWRSMAPSTSLRIRAQREYVLEASLCQLAFSLRSEAASACRQKAKCVTATAWERSRCARKTPVVVSPTESEVLSLEPAFILPQEGETKQDCEIKAAKRWFEGQAPHYQLEGAIALGDDLYCHQPYCQLLLAKGLNFILHFVQDSVLVCKPDRKDVLAALGSHPTLYEYLALYPPEELRKRGVFSLRSEVERTSWRALALPLC